MYVCTVCVGIRAKLHEALGQVSALMIEQCSAALFRIVRLVSSSSSSGDQVVATVTVLLRDEAGHPTPAEEGAETQSLSGVRLRVETQGLAPVQEVSLEGCDSILRGIPVVAAQS
jgi:hypothetical protein